MREVIERVRQAEEQANQISAAAERQAGQLLEQARLEARELAEKKKQYAHQQAEALLKEAQRAAWQRREELLAQVDADLRKVSDLDPQARTRAVNLIFQAVAFPISSPAQGSEPKGS